MNITEKYFQDHNIEYAIENGIICVEGTLSLDELQGQQHPDFLKSTKVGCSLYLRGLGGQQHPDFLKSTTIGHDLYLNGLEGKQHKNFLKSTIIGCDLWLNGLQEPQHKNFLKSTIIGCDLWLEGLQGQQHKDFLKSTKVGGRLWANIPNKTQKLIEGVFDDYIYVDGILTDKLSSLTVDDFIFHETSFGFVCEKDNVYAHGKTLQQARRNYISKQDEITYLKLLIDLTYLNHSS